MVFLNKIKKNTKILSYYHEAKMRLATILLISFFINFKALAETYFPSNTWETRTAEDVNLNNNQIDKLFKLTFNDKLLDLFLAA